MRLVIYNWSPGYKAIVYAVDRARHIFIQDFMSTSWVEYGEKYVCRDYSFILAHGGIAPSDLLPEGAVDLCDFRDKGRSSSVCDRDRDGDAR